MASEADILVKFGADVGPLKKGAKTASTSIAGVGAAAANNAKKLAALGAVAAVAGAALGIKLVGASMSAIDVQAKLAKQLDTSSKSIANLELAASLSGVSINDVATAAKALNVKLADAAGGTGTAVEVLKDLGLTVKDLSMMDLDEKIGALNKAIKENIDPTEQAAYAADLFGTRAGAAIAMLDSETIKSASDQIERFGLAISDIDAAKVEAANDAIEILKRSTDGLVQQFTVALAPAIEAAANALSEDFISASGDMQSGVQDAANAAIDAFASVLEGAAGLIGIVEENPDLAKFGLIGYMLWGKKGLLMGAAIGGIFDSVKEKMVELGVASGALDPTLKKIDDLNWEIKRLSAHHLTLIDPEEAQAVNDRITVLQADVSDLTGTIVEGSDAFDELNDRLNGGTEEGNLLSQTMLNVAAAIREAKSASNEASGAAPVIPGITAPSEAPTGPEGESPEDAAMAKKEKKEADHLAYMTLINKQYTEGRLISGEDFSKTDLERQADYNATLVADKKITDKKLYDGTHKALGDISSLMQASDKESFRVGQIAAVAQASMDGISAAIGSYKVGAGIGGPPLGAAFALSSALATGTMINKLLSASPTGGSSGSPAAGVSTTTPTPDTPADAAESAPRSQSQSLYISGIDPGSMFSGEQVRSLIDKINEAGSDGKQVMLT
jgi:hypothetical protein